MCKMNSNGISTGSVSNISKWVHMMRTKDRRISAASSFQHSLHQISQSPLLILKEALHVIHNEIKRNQSDQSSLPVPPQGLCLFSLGRWYGCVRKQQRKEPRGKWRQMKWGQVKKTNSDRKDKVQILSTVVASAVFPSASERKSGSFIVLMDDWVFTGWPWDLHRGQEGSRLKAKQECFLDVCFYAALCDCRLLKQKRNGCLRGVVIQHYLHSTPSIHLVPCKTNRNR